MSLVDLTLPWVQSLDTLDRADYDNVEVAPCAYLEDGVTVERIDDPSIKPDFWSVYLHCTWGGVECVADFATEAEADAYAETLKGWLKG